MVLPAGNMSIWASFLWDLQGLKAHAPEKNRCSQGVPKFQFPLLTGSPTALWQNYRREKKLADQSSLLRRMLFVLVHWLHHFIQSLLRHGIYAITFKATVNQQF